MKTKTLLFVFFIIGAIYPSFGQTQNSIWSLPPYNYISGFGIQPLPTVSPPALGYDGSTATTVSNAMQDANGDLLFFIVDGEIYDKDGYTIGILDYVINTTLSIKGTAEVAIAPVPGNCAQYYIIMAGRNSYTNSLSSKLPVIALLDMSVPSSINVDRLGEIVYGATIKEILPIGAPDIDIDEQGKQGSSYFAVSRESNGKRFVFISNPANIFRFIMDGTGLHYDGFIPVTFGTGGNDLEFRGEMELVEVNNNGDVKYRLAFHLPYRSLDPNNLNTNVVYIYNLDNDGEIAFDNNGMDKYYLPYFHYEYSVFEQAYVHGLEFSPDGEILYITHTTNPTYPNAFDFFDFNNISAGIQSVPGVSLQDALNFEYSQIEIGKSGNLYLAYSGGLATFSNPNNPSLGILNLNALSFNYEANREGYSGNDIRLKSYILPDQIDGMNYNGIGYPATHSVQSYTATVSGVWQSGSNPWNNTSAEILVHENLIIPSGRNITIKNMTFRFAPDAKVIIEQGAKLTLDKGVFTNANVDCDIQDNNYWRGIEVYGTTSQHQYPTMNPTYQGMLVVKNGGVIENAQVGAVNWKEGDFNMIGGVIRSTKGVFRNNRKDIAFLTYSNYLPGNPMAKQPNLSFFKDTDFLSNDNFIEKGLAKQVHVSLWEVSGVKFINCHFSNQITDKDNSSAPNGGIYSINAGYKVEAGCGSIQPIGQPCPTPDLLKSSFSGFETAIKMTGASTSEVVTIQHADFIDNISSIIIDEFDNVSINRNEIEIGDANYTLSWPSGSGVNITNSTGYIIEENKVTTALTGHSYLGIGVNNSGTEDNRVYKNNLTDLSYGVTGNGVNHNSNYQKGLQFLCNEFQNNKSAISINSSPAIDGVRFYQGDFSPAKSAGNTFLNNTMDIRNSANSIVYMHNSGNTEPNNYQGMVSLQYTANANSCPTSFGVGIIMKSTAFILDSLNMELVRLTTSYNDLNFTYTSLIDDGNTEIFKDNIELNWSNDAWLLRDKLLSISPYLSSEALLEAAKQNVLTQWNVIGNSSC